MTPEIETGDISLRYKGTTVILIPTIIPRKNLKITEK